MSLGVRGVAAALVASAATLAIAPGAVGSPSPRTLVFEDPLLVSDPVSSAWEPTMLIDRFGNIYITARKDTYGLALSADERSPTKTRSQSWMWTSTDGGRTWGTMPGLPLNLENHEWGYEADIALDDADHLYFVDQTYVDSTVTRWTVNGLGAHTMDLHRPVLPTSHLVDDRPWLAAHGDGKLTYIVNSGDPVLNPLGRDGGEAYGPGRFSVYRSTDAAQTFEPMGHSLNGSGGCRSAADHAPGSRTFVIVCTNDGNVAGPLDVPSGRGILWAYVSEDDGASYARYRVGDYNADADTFDWPLVTVAPNGDFWALHVDADRVETASDGSFQILTNKLNLYHSTDRGRTWSRQDITPRTGRYRWGWLVTSPAGKLAFAIQHRPNATSPWHAYASVFAPGERPELSPIDPTNPIDAASSPEPPSEIMGIAFTRGGRLAVAWTRIEPAGNLRFRRVYFARSVVAPSVKKPPVVRGGGVARPSLPATGLDEDTAAAVALIAASLLGASMLRRFAAR